MKVVCANASILEVIGKVFRHSFGKRGDKDSLLVADTGAYFFSKVVNLVFCRADFNRGVKEAGRADNLLNDTGIRRQADSGGRYARPLNLICPRRC